VDPATLATLFSAGSSVLGGGGSGPAAPSSATSGPSSFRFDNSGWTVSTGSSSAGLQLSPLVLAGVGLVALLVLWRLTKKS
jgi:hypothetical protein